MKRIGIVTFSNSINYGGVLQAFALSSSLKKIDLIPTNITCQKMTSNWNSPTNYVFTRIKLYGCKGIDTKFRIMGGFVKTLCSNVHYNIKKKKRKAFELFIAQYLNVTPLYLTSEELKKHCSDYDVYITGSDQVWNMDFAFGESMSPFFLTFVPRGRPCISYAASVGGQKSDEYIKRVILLTEKFEAISVREQSLCNQMRALGCKRVVVMPDPVTLIEKKEWEMIAIKPSIQLPKKYILLYCLELDLSQSQWLTQIANQLNLPIIDIMPSYKKKKYKCYCDYFAGPGEFIYYIKNAEYVITNSFHLTLFSLIFGKKFLTLQRKGQENRVSDLLKQYGLLNHIVYEGGTWSILKEEIDPIDFSEEKNRGFQFLRMLGELG